MAIHIPRLRHLRRALKGINLGGGRRRRRIKEWATSVATDLDATGTGQVFTADFANNEIDIAAHGYTDGDGPFQVSTDTTLPAGLGANTLYWVNAVTAGTLSLHRSLNDAVNGANAVELTDAGTGIQTLTPSITAQAIIEQARQGVSTERLTSATDIDDFIPASLGLVVSAGIFAEAFSAAFV